MGRTVSTDEYLDRILAKFAGSFDIIKDYSISLPSTGELTYAAYGYFCSLSEKYVLTKKANLWTTVQYEHVLFIRTEECTEELIDQVYTVMKEYIEPVLVREGGKYPHRDHMESLMTAVFICEKKPSEAVVKRIRRFRFGKSYLFTVRGRAEGRAVEVDMESEEVVYSPRARGMKKAFDTAFDEIRKGVRGYEELYAGADGAEDAAAGEESSAEGPAEN